MKPRNEAFPDFHLDALAYEIGEARDVEELALVNGEPESTVRSLITYGIRTYRKSSLSPEEMATRCIRKTLAAADVDPADIRTVVYATESFWHSEYQARSVGRMLKDAGLLRAYPIGVFGSACGNLAPALQCALDHLRSGDEEHVLVVSVDLELDGAHRIIEPPVSVSSDGASSCLISRTRRRGFAIRNLTKGFYKFSGSDGGPSGLGLLQDTQAAIRKYLGEHMREIDVTAGGYRRLITNNYIPATLKLYALTGGFEFSKLYLDNVGRLGHLSLSDTLVNLSDCVGKSPPAPGDLYLLICNGLNPGLSMWGFLTLEAV